MMREPIGLTKDRTTRTGQHALTESRTRRPGLRGDSYGRNGCMPQSGPALQRAPRLLSRLRAQGCQAPRDGCHTLALESASGWT